MLLVLILVCSRNASPHKVFQSYNTYPNIPTIRPNSNEIVRHTREDTPVECSNQTMTEINILLSLIAIALPTLQSDEVSATPYLHTNLRFKKLQKVPVANASSNGSVGDTRLCHIIRLRLYRLGEFWAKVEQAVHHENNPGGQNLV